MKAPPSGERSRGDALVVDDALELVANVPGVPSSSVVCRLEPALWRLPDELEHLRERWHERHPDEWSGPRTTVQRMEWSDPRAPRILARPSEWKEGRAWQEPFVESGASWEEKLRVSGAALECLL